MKSWKIIWILILSTLGISLYRCKSEEIILHGEISGIVTDVETSQPVEAAKVILSPVNSSTNTVSDGTYYLKNIQPGNYLITVTKNTYSKQDKTVIVYPAQTSVINFTLNRRATPHISDSYLDFGSDILTREFTISNAGSGRMTYFLEPDKKWIEVEPAYGDVGDETDTIRVTIDKTDLSKTKYIEKIKLFSIVGDEVILDTVGVYLNGMMDQDMNYYNVVKIGTQTWMAENLNVGNFTTNLSSTANDGIIQKYCYNNEPNNCDIYGGLYEWDEMMQYYPSDDKITGTTQGVCPVGWHIPTKQEWETLFYFLGGWWTGMVYKDIGGKLKDTNALWHQPNFGATNESGFTALPGGALNPLFSTQQSFWYWGIGEQCHLWSSTWGFSTYLDWGNADVYNGGGGEGEVIYVRCVKDPPKNK